MLIVNTGLDIVTEVYYKFHTIYTATRAGYKIPQGGAFRLVSGANFAGEILEWSGWALAAGGQMPASAFALFTFCNIAPRAWHHHCWYKDKFDDYPKERRAVIPFVW